MLNHVYSGDLFFSSLGVLALVVCLDLAGLFDRSAAWQSVARVTCLVAIGLAAFTSTPVHLWLAVPGVTAVVLLLGARRKENARLRRVAGVSVVLLVAVCMGLEARFHLGRPEMQRPVRVVIVGDSLSSGGFGEFRPWPWIIGETLGAEIVNLSRPGDTVSAALEGQVPDVPSSEPGDLIILEVGGNDMLEGGSARAYEASLAELSGRVGEDRRQVVMFELPLLPGKWAWGAAQRRVAKEHGIALIPKRVLARVLLDPANTSDGLHLTGPGHEALARAVTKWAGW